MQNKLLILFSIFIFYFYNLSNGQILKEFSKNPTQFQVELTTLFHTTQSDQQKEEGEKVITEFITLWNTNKIQSDQKDSIFDMCNIMLKRKLKTYPFFYDYIKASILFSKSYQTEESYGAWIIGLKSLIRLTNTIRLQSLLECTNLLLEKKVLYESKLTNWKTNTDEFSFKFDSTICIVFPSLDLSCTKKNDSTCIYKTSGIYYPTTNKWKGGAGTIYWDRAGIAQSEAWADFKKYNITLSRTDFKVDTVVFYNTNFFSKPLLGSLEEKVFADVSEERISYPRFTSFDKRLKIREVFKDIDFEGGFGMFGAKLIGIGDQENDAYLTIKRQGKKFVRLASRRFIIRKESFASDQSAVSIYWDKDSIFHPGLIAKFIIKNNDKSGNEDRVLTLSRDKEGLAASPFYDFYHKIDMYVEFVTWNLDEPKIKFSMSLTQGSESSAYFESFNYFSQSRYENLQGLDDIHPLSVFRRISVEKGSKTLSLKEIQRSMGVSIDQITNMIIRFSAKGFFIYDKDNEEVTLTERVFNYTNANLGKTDYDILRFQSTIASSEGNASLSLLNFDLTLKGVPKVSLSDSQGVYIYPTEQILVMKKNRDFIFDGKIRSGLFDFFTKRSYFNYDMFKFELPNIDSMSFFVQDRSQPLDMYGHHPLIRVRTVIEDMTGDMLIDGQNNKSGRVSFPEYPIFNSKKDAYAYYNKSYIQGGVYTKDKFYYRVYPFKIDKLDDYESEKKEFKGYLVSAGIFPDINEPLRVQPDFSLGFIYTTTTVGLPAYGGKAKYDSIIDLSFKGFLGQGTLHYQTSIMKSNDITFHPDSMFANAQYFEIKEKSTPPNEYPPVVATNVEVRYYPYQDNMKVIQKGNPFTMYTNNTQLKGTLNLSSKRLTGGGNVSFGKVEMNSNNYLFKHHSYSADTANVLFKTPDLSEIVISTTNFNVNINFQTQIGKFASNDEDSKTNFPFNYYSCNNYNFDWYMDKDLLNFISKQKKEMDHLKLAPFEDRIAVDYSSSEFTSEHPGQDSLHFYSPTATYNLTENIIRTKDVPVILVADAAIFPDSGRVTILRKAEMLPLDNANIIANTESRYHKIYKSNLNIVSRKLYNGNGIYDYIDEFNKREKIFLHTISVDSAGQTIGKGTLKEKDAFTLSPFFEFIGHANLTADKEFLCFNGGCRIKNECDTLYHPWLRFKSDINPREIAIPVSLIPKECNQDTSGRITTGDDIGNGLYVTSDTSMVYSAFLEEKRKSSDSALVYIEGFLTYDKSKQIYTIAPIVDSSSKFLPAVNSSKFDIDKCIATADGEIHLGAKFGRMEMRTFGLATNTILDGNTNMDLVMTLDFPFDNDAMAFFSKAISSEAGTEDIDQSADIYYNSLKMLMGPEKADKILSQLSLRGQLKDIPDELTHSMFFSELKFIVNHKSRSLITEGPIGLVSINKDQFYKKMEGVIEISRKMSTYTLNMYFEVGNDWYYFTYSNNRLMVVSSKADFNNFIKKAVTDGKNQIKAEDNKPSFVFQLSSPTTKEKFLKRVRPQEDEEKDEEEE